MMKKLLVVLTVLAIATVANAALVSKISVNGDVDMPDTQINLLPSDTAVIDIHMTASDSVTSIVLLMQGPATIAKGPGFSAWEQSKVTIPSDFYADYLAAFTEMGYTDITQIVDVDIMDITEPFTTPNGKVVDGLILHCEAIGDVTLTLFNTSLEVLDSQVIHQVPEPMTLALLGLGGLLLRRRK
jgi:hypothetical protein